MAWARPDRRVSSAASPSCAPRSIEPRRCSAARRSSTSTVARCACQQPGCETELVAWRPMTSADVRVAQPRMVFAGPGLQVNGLEAVAEGLWLCDQQDNHSYLVDYTGKVLTSFASPARNASGISFGAGSVWVGSNVDPPMIFRHDPATGQCTAFLMLDGPGGVHGLQWQPYASSETRPSGPEARSELHPTAPAGKRN